MSITTQKTLCYFKDSFYFTHFMKSLQPFITKQNNYMLLESTDGETVIGYACDNVRFAKQVYPDYVSIMEPFSVYLSPMSIYPKKNEGNVKLSMDANGYAVIEFGTIKLQNSQPQTPLDFHKLYECVQKTIIENVALDRKRLQETVQSLKSPYPGLGDGVSIEFQGPLNPVKIVNGANERYIMPVRFPDSK